MKNKRARDERVVAETNQIYKVGYLILSIGILVDLCTQFSGLQLTGQGASLTFRPVELGVFLLAQAVCVVLMARRGFMDDGRFAEAERFPKGHYARCGLAAGAAAAAVFTGLRLLAYPSWAFGARAFAIASGVLFASLTVLVAGGVYLAFYLTFLAARSRRRKLEKRLEE